MDTGGVAGLNGRPSILRAARSRAGMRIFILTVVAATAAVVLASGTAAPNTEVPAEPAVESQGAGKMPSGPLFGPLTPEDVGHSPVSVPEPVWASVLAACAVSLLRRGRGY
jgi:hypothetical protein